MSELCVTEGCNLVLKHDGPCAVPFSKDGRILVPYAPPTQKPEAVNHPNHYGGDTVYETIKVLAAWGCGFLIGNAIKYMSRAGKKDPSKRIEDLEKARFYLDYAIRRLKAGDELF